MAQIRGFKRMVIQSLDTWLLSSLKFFDYFLRLAGPAFACIAVVLISGVIWAWFSFVLPNIAPPGTLIRYFHIVIAIFLIVNVFFNYFKTLFTPPGQPADDYGINLDIEGGVNEETKHWDGFGRFCKKCMAGL